jgi:hypothetical protein
VNANFDAAPAVMVKLGELTAEVNPVAAAVNVYVPAKSILQPTNVATPETAVNGFALVQLKTELPGTVIVNVTGLELVVTVLPPASCTFTTGCVAKATLLAASLGCVVNATFVAEPTVIATDELVARVRPGSVAVNVYVPARSILQPTNVATPETAVNGFALVHVSSAPAGVVIANVTAVMLLVTVLPPASWIATTGWVPKAVPPVDALGEVVNASFAAAPTVIVNELLIAEVNPVPVAVNV